MTSKGFKAMLRRDISFTDMYGNIKSFHKGKIVTIRVIPMGSSYTDSNFNSCVYTKDCYIAVSGQESVDILPMEFKTID